MSDPSPSRFVSRQRIYFDMLDALHILHNAAYILLIERARFDLWRSHGFGPGSPEIDWPYFVARNEIDYKAPIPGEQEVTVTVSVSNLGRSSITFAHEIYRSDGTLSAIASTVLVRVDPNTHKPIPWSDRFQTLVAPYVICK